MDYEYEVKFSNYSINLQKIFILIINFFKSVTDFAINCFKENLNKNDGNLDDVLEDTNFPHWNLILDKVNPWKI
jgi:hypothetical protein